MGYMFVSWTHIVKLGLNLIYVKFLLKRCQYFLEIYIWGSVIKIKLMHNQNMYIYIRLATIYRK